MATKDDSKKKVQINVDRELANQAQMVFDQIGLSQTSALTAFYKRVVAEGGMPFELKMTPRQRQNLALDEVLSDLPVADLTTKPALEDWLNDKDQDY